MDAGLPLSVPCMMDNIICDWVQSASWPSGKGLGGTSLLNYMQYLRGSRHDYDSWANGGAAGWAYKDVLPYFIKAEDQQNGEFVRTGWSSRSAIQHHCRRAVAAFNRSLQMIFIFCAYCRLC